MRRPLLQRLGGLPEGTCSLSCLEGGELVTGAKSGVSVFARSSGLSLMAEADCEATCVEGLGTQTVAAGDRAGRVRVWHLRRNKLQEVRSVQAHFAAVRALSSGGDILLTASEDGTVKQLDVLANFVPGDFFETGVPATSVMARGKNVLVGCQDGVVWELSRRLRQPVVLRRLELGAPVRLLDADPEAPGARVLAAGSGRLAVWLDMPKSVAPQDVQPPAFVGERGLTEEAALLLPGKAEDLLLIPCGARASHHAWSHELASAKACCCLVRSGPTFFFVADVSRKTGELCELFGLSEDARDEALAGGASAPQEGPTGSLLCEENGSAAGPRRALRRANTFSDPTQAPQPWQVAKLI
ncbi:unnamed protein product [Effrenium voratum]|nr:unnamed protein product [Effrenium voratum]